MKIFECKCGSKEVFIKENGNNKGLYCADCGKWIQWLGKDDLRLVQRQIEQSIINPIPRNLDELKEHDKQIMEEAYRDGINKAFKFIETNMEEFRNIFNSNSSYEASRKIWHFAEMLGGIDVWK